MLLGKYLGSLFAKFVIVSETSDKGIESVLGFAGFPFVAVDTFQFPIL